MVILLELGQAVRRLRIGRTSGAGRSERSTTTDLLAGRSLRPAPEVLPILTADSLAELQQMTTDVYVDRAIIDYAVALTTATRQPETVGLSKVSRSLRHGAR